ncbi:hypothetical protein BU14_0178s0012 [Porphyra umbilicalis]|uniref:Piwi domain-containing protein n=1 Tax=Porphyra umbilicalis TaxID=2786 RepID=A0A1X6P7F0_PORUM|nr:hypothetical protein BU14_0178s0012 [Porphyra umbilicalis]|eukprot:OSX76696.1 hypothetical protein BU14_0178s0012 [Porphyra umbilicalis]
MHPGGSNKRPMYLPIEVVQIVGAQRRHRLTDQQTSKLKDMACTKPPVRFQNVSRLRRVAAYETDEYLKEFGLTVEPAMLHVSGRALSPPTLIYNHALTVQPANGRWNMKDKMYYQAGPILHYWGVLILQDSRGRMPPGGGRVKQDFMRFLTTLESVSRKTGLAISNMNPMILVRSKSDVAQAMREIKETVDGDAREHGQPGCQLILIVKPTNETSDYREIKFQSDSVHGCPSQCMLSKHMERVNIMYCANLGLKINSKLGGGNVTLTQPSLDRLKARKTLMIMGLDLSLESKAIARTTDAVAAVVGTLNHQYTEYASAYRFQLAKEEHIMDLTKLAQDVFTSFFERWQKLPEALLVYRDGVADSQMKHVLDVERDALVEAYQNVQPGSTPEITMVVTQKRHRTRFMPVNQSQGDKAGNCKPGLCVDGDITQPHQFEFYLQSHTALQGTSRPVRHVVLVNELGLSSDELQEITNSLCYVNARCTLSTSMVAPTAYSALVAERGASCGRARRGRAPTTRRAWAAGVATRRWRRSTTTSSGRSTSRTSSTLCERPRGLSALAGLPPLCFRGILLPSVVSRIVSGCVLGAPHHFSLFLVFLGLLGLLVCIDVHRVCSCRFFSSCSPPRLGHTVHGCLSFLTRFSLLGTTLTHTGHAGRTTPQDSQPKKKRPTSTHPS